MAGLEAVSVLVQAAGASAAAIVSAEGAVKRWAEAFRLKGADLLGGLPAEDCIRHRPGGNVVGIDATREVMRDWFETSARE